MEVIRVENLSKLYDLGQVGTGTLSKDLNRWWARARGKEDPYARLGKANDRTKKAGKDDSVWALKDINFSVEQGDVVGIIGRNGAGKSTLLKIISQITAPTNGSIKVRGRIASLLEVGTGFHPEMTGRENIFMNGTLLGMTRKEIQRKLDEIVEFAGVTMYVDTPVKRYSSGMQVRLGFAVAAFLEPEILIVDEVLAVGDAEFQKKAIGRMQEVSKGDGRTVLFVSHNMAAVQSLCGSAILLEQGEVAKLGLTESVIKCYIDESSLKYAPHFESPTGIFAEDRSVKFFRAKLLVNQQLRSQISLSESFDVVLHYQILNQPMLLSVTIVVYDTKDQLIFVSPSTTEKSWFGKPMPIGCYSCYCEIPGNLLNEGAYYISILLVENSAIVKLKLDKVLMFHMVEDGILRANYFGPWLGAVRPKLNWRIKHDNDVATL